MAPRTPDILDCASAQWIGKRREQEDVVKSLPAAGGMLGIVCDGMGGHLRGDCASCVVAQEFAVVFAESGIEDIPERLTAALHAANRALAAIQKEPEESGTTLLAVFIRDHFLWWISVGDSPLYLWSGADSFRMDRLNEDHSMRPIADCLYRKGKCHFRVRFGSVAFSVPPLWAVPWNWWTSAPCPCSCIREMRCWHARTACRFGASC